MNLKLKENSPTILLKVHDSDQDNSVCNFAVVTITKDLLELISKLRKARELAECYEVTKFYGCADFLNQDDFASEKDEENISEELVDALYDITKDNKGSWSIEPFGEQPSLRTEADLVHVSDFGIKFTAYQKYSNVRLSTEKISFEELDALIIK